MSNKISTVVDNIATGLAMRTIPALAGFFETRKQKDARK